MSDCTDPKADPLKRQRDHDIVLADVSDIQEFVASLPDRDTRPVDELLGYDDFGLPSN